jgi:hypothetical protein
LPRNFILLPLPSLECISFKGMGERERIDGVGYGNGDLKGGRISEDIR